MVIILPGGIRIAVTVEIFLRDHGELAETVLFAPEYHILVRMCRGMSRNARNARRGVTHCTCAIRTSVQEVTVNDEIVLKGE